MTAVACTLCTRAQPSQGGSLVLVAGRARAYTVKSWGDAGVRRVRGTGQISDVHFTYR